MNPGKPILTLFKPECRKDWWHDKKLLILAPRAHASGLGPLLEAYKHRNIVVECSWYDEQIPTQAELNVLADGIDAMLFLAPANRAPSTLVAAPYIIGPSGKKIPIGLLPVKDAATVNTFAQTAAKVQIRQGTQPAMALLAQRLPRYLRIAERIEAILQTEAPHLHYFKWSGDVMVREDLLQGLNLGLGMALYVGHGRPSGWVGYYGTRAKHFEGYQSEPLGAMISLCCYTNSRKKIGLSFSEALVTQGIAAASFGAITKTKHTDNTRWALRITENMAEGVMAIGELILKSLPQDENAALAYRLIGDPLAPIIAAEESIEQAKNIPVYA